MEIRHLKLIKTIVEEGTLAAASEKLFLTAGALSQQLKEVESQLGAPVFHRINRKMVLTNVGKKVYETAKNVLSELAKVDHEISTLLYGEKGTIRLSTECYTSYHWLPPLLQSFQKQYPNVDIEIVMEATYDPVVKLLDGGLEMAITTDVVDHDDLHHTPLFRDEMVAVVSKNHEWTGKELVEPKDFKDQHLIIHSLPLKTVTVYQCFLKPAHIEPKKIIALPLTEASIAMVKAEMGVMVMAKWALRPYLADKSLATVKLGKDGLKRTHYVATLKKDSDIPYLQAFIAYLKAEIDLGDSETK